MKKILAIMLALLLAAAVFVGCQRNETQETDPGLTEITGESGSDLPGQPPEGSPGEPPDGMPGEPPDGMPGEPPDGMPGEPPEGGPDGEHGGEHGGPGGSSDTTETPAVVTKASATDLKADDGSAVYSGSAVVTFGGREVTLNAAYIIDGVSATVSSGEYRSDSGSSDEVVFLVVNGGRLTVEGNASSPVAILKSGSAASSGQVGDDYNFYGINSGVVVAGKGSEASIANAKIVTSAAGSNAVVATNGGAVSIEDSSIETTGSAGSRGLHATYTGSITASGVSITTQGRSCAALATDRGGGTVTASDMELETNGAGSPLIYSTGEIVVKNSEGSSNAAQAVVVEGGSSASIEGCSFTCSGGGNREGTSESNHSSHGIDACGVFIYQSFSGDASEGTDYFSAKDSTIKVTANDVPMFFITNITAGVTLEGNTFDYSCDYFIIAEETSEWGKVGSNGGTAEFTLTDQSLSGLKAFAGSSSSKLTFKATDGSGTDIEIVNGAW